MGACYSRKGTGRQNGLCRLRALRAEARRAASALTGEALALHGTADRTADVSTLDRLPDWSPRLDWTRVRIDGAPHQLCTSPWRGHVADEVARARLGRYIWSGPRFRAMSWRAQDPLTLCQAVEVMVQKRLGM